MAKENGVSEPTGIEEISRLLLQGWTMLADVCPRAGCNMPLMRSRQGRVLCCTCRADVVITATPSDTNPNETTSNQVSPTIQTYASEDAGPPSNTAHENENDDAGSRNTDQNPQAAGIVSTHVNQARAKPNNPSCHPASSDDRANAIDDTAAERAVIPVNVSTSPTRDVESIGGALDRRLLAGWTLTREACGTCGAALLRNALDGRVECVTCGAPINSQLTNAENRTVARDVNVVHTSHQVQIAPRQTRDTHGSAGTIVPSSTREPRRGPVASTARAQQRGVGLAGSGGMLDMGAGGAGGLGARRVGGRAAVGEVPTLEPRPAGSGGGGEEYMGDVEVDVDRELLLAEIAVAHDLRSLRCALADAADAETIRVLCAGIVSAADAITATRRARQARSRVRTIN